MAEFYIFVFHVLFVFNRYNSLTFENLCRFEIAGIYLTLLSGMQLGSILGIHIL